MGRKLILTAADGHMFGAYRADPPGTAKGRVVVVQEIFGVNRHIRAVCDRLAQAGYVALAPHIFDRQQRDFECGYSDAEVARAREFLPRLDWAKVVLDTAAGVEALKREGPTAVIGFCMGGTAAYLAATRLDGLAAAVCFYGGQIARHADNRPRCPTQMHFGEVDTHIPMSDVAAIKMKRADSDIHVYAGAGHGFYCEERASYEPNSAKIAWDRTLQFLARGFAAAAAKMRPAAQAKPAAKPKPKAKKRKPARKAKKKAAGKSKKKSAKPKKKPKKRSKKRR